MPTVEGASAPLCPHPGPGNNPGPPGPVLRASRTTLPEATRAAQMNRWGLRPERLGDLNPGQRRGALADDAIVHDEDHDPDDGTRGFLQDGGWHTVEPTKGRQRGGGTSSHRGVLHPDEYVHEDVLRALVSEHLGFTTEDVRSVYRQGPLGPEGRALRARIDARLLEVAERGGLMLELARALGWAVKPGGPDGGASCNTIERALQRAREATS